MKGYEGCYYSEYESEEEGANKHSEKKTNRVEEGRWVKNVSCSHLVVSGDGTKGKIVKKKKEKKRNQEKCFRINIIQKHNHTWEKAVSMF